MPRQIDLGSGLPVTHNALERLAVDPKVAKIDIAAILEQWGEFVEDHLLDLIKQVTGVDLKLLEELLSGKWDLLEQIRRALQGLDLSDPGSVLAAIVAAAGQFFNGVIPLSWIGDVVKDLLTNGDFRDASSVANNPDWAWDAAVPGHLSGGSVRTSATSAVKVLRSNLIQVVKGQTMDLQVFAKWSGMAAAAGSNPLQLAVTPYSGAGSPLTQVVIAALQPSAADGGWTSLSGSYTVPDGVSGVATTLRVTDGATSGIVWFSNASTHMTNKMPLNYVVGLVDQLAQFTTQIQDTLEELARKAGLTDLADLIDTIADKASADLNDIIHRLQHIGTDGLFDASKLFNLDNIAAGIPIEKILNLPNQLAQLATTTFVNALRDLIGGNSNSTNAQIQARLSALNASGQIDAAKLLGTIAKTSVQGLGDLEDSVVSGFQNMFNSWFGGSSAVGTPTEVATTIEAIKQAVIGGYVVDTFTSNGTWTKPPNLIEWYGVAIGGGGKGMPGEGVVDTSGAIHEGGVGGSSGGYIAQQIEPAAVPASVAVSIGTGATTNGADGGITSIGSLVSSSPNGNGISTITGYLSTSSMPGSGGKGGSASGGAGSGGTATAGTSGGSAALGAGGAGGQGKVGTGNQVGNSGSTGGTASLTGPTKSGGGGGGGGGGVGGSGGLGSSYTGGSGGNGGYPGGGSGGGGTSCRGGSYGTMNAGNPGNPAHGVAFIIYKAGA